VYLQLEGSQDSNKNGLSLHISKITVMIRTAAPLPIYPAVFPAAVAHNDASPHIYALFIAAIHTIQKLH